jgi:hypothetical protein
VRPFIGHAPVLIFAYSWLREACYNLFIYIYTVSFYNSFIYHIDAALNKALTQLQLPLFVASFIFLAFACSSVAERFLAPGSSTY